MPKISVNAGRRSPSLSSFGSAYTSGKLPNNRLLANIRIRSMIGKGYKNADLFDNLNRCSINQCVGDLSCRACRGP